MFNNSMVRNLTVLGQNLKHGDYSVKGFESQIIAERKMPSDFYQYVGKDRDHKSKPKGITTVDKLEYISQATCKMLLVEASWEGLYSFPFTGCSQSSARAFFYSTLIKYGIPKFVTPDRTEMRRLIIEHFYYTYRLLRGER